MTQLRGLEIHFKSIVVLKHAVVYKRYEDYRVEWFRYERLDLDDHISRGWLYWTYDLGAKQEVLVMNPADAKLKVWFGWGSKWVE